MYPYRLDLQHKSLLQLYNMSCQLFTEHIYIKTLQIIPKVLCFEDGFYSDSYCAAHGDLFPKDS